MITVHGHTIQNCSLRGYLKAVFTPACVGLKITCTWQLIHHHSTCRGSPPNADVCSFATRSRAAKISTFSGHSSPQFQPTFLK